MKDNFSKIDYCITTSSAYPLYQKEIKMNRKDIISTVCVFLVAVVLIIIGITGGITLDDLQKETLTLVTCIAAFAALYCFIVGEISRNNSQMDKLWSILPEIYLWVIAIKGGMTPRLIVMAVLATAWGIRLTYNFAKKGAYSLRFWAGEEDYRWRILRKNKYLGNRIIWAVFDLLFISFYQNFVVLLTTLPAIALMSSTASFGIADILFALLLTGFLTLETVADAQQWKFHQKKKQLLREGKQLKDLPHPYCRGFNTTGLWAYARHPNYLGEQMIWICMYLFTISAGSCAVNWSITGCMLLVLLFLGSSTLAEGISCSKYEEYKDYQQKASKYLPLPWKKY